MKATWRSIAPGPASGDWEGELLAHAPVGGAGIPPRPIFAYLPPGYDARDRARRRPLLLMQDGQNLFDPSTSFAGSWNVPAAIDALVAAGVAAPVVVGVPNSGTRRLFEYAPFVDPRHGGGGAPAYLDFLLGAVRPLALRSFAVERQREAHGLGGASLGGSFSLWGLFASGGAFGRVLAMSPTTLFAGEALRDFLGRGERLPARIWLDCGLEEGRRRSRRRTKRASPTAYVRRVRRLRRALEALGWRRDADLRYLEEPGGVHHESAWARRLPGALAWLFGDG